MTRGEIETLLPSSSIASVLDAEIREDGRLLAEVICLIATQTPLSSWPAGTTAALAEAIGPGRDPRENVKAERLMRHLFAGAPPAALSKRTGAMPRRADRLRADLADLVDCGAGLYLVAETS